uniref:UDENN domain-containing protein n=1 Tax=Parastrongyloides trichosuri TaxID=131310 RepID=A0A0N4ZBV8_PARTI
MSVSSRLKQNPTSLVDVFVEMGIVKGNNKNCGVGKDILSTFPINFDNQDLLKSIKQFAFPWKSPPSSSNAIQLFTFVLTDGNGFYTFGYCRYNPTINTCICILSSLPWHTFFFKLLDLISTVINSGGNIINLFNDIKNKGIPTPGTTLTIEDENYDKYTIEVPFLDPLTTMKENKFLMDFYNAMPEKSMIKYYTSLLKERRIIITGSKMSQICACCFSVDHLLYPFSWQNLFIPILPHELIDTVMAPMPFIIGVHKDTYNVLNFEVLGDVVVFDIDDKSFNTPFKEDTLPAPIYDFLKNELKYLSDNFLTESLTKVFLRSNVLLFGKYRQGLRMKEGSVKVSWDRKVFLEAQHTVLKKFLSTLLGRDGVQYFERFVDERTIAINCGLPIDDDFEREFSRLDGNMEKIMTRPSRDIVENAFLTIRQKISKITSKDPTKISKIEAAKKHRIRTASPFCSSPVLVQLNNGRHSNSPSSNDSTNSNVSTQGSYCDSIKESNKIGRDLERNSTIVDDLISFEDPPKLPETSPPPLISDSSKQLINFRQNWEIFE